ncbi:hypothetical protein LJC19_03025 [Oxalobacter sp. OttesenSCG-928-P03]|nr:hypothetical protein [Oxalobacter sp. OttesenSCG-928-P03]
MKTYYFPLIFCSVFFISACTDNAPAKPATRKTAVEEANRLSVSPEDFSRRFNQCMEKLQKTFRIEDIPKIKVGPNQDTFQSNPTHQITIIGTVDKKTGNVVNAMLVARGNDEQGMENIIVHATGMVAGYKPEIGATNAKKEIRSLIAAYSPQKEESISRVYQNLRLTYGMQADMGLSHFSVRPAE